MNSGLNPLTRLTLKCGVRDVQAAGTGAAARVQAQRVAAASVGQQQGGALRVSVPAVPPLQQREQHRVQIASLLGKPVFEAVLMRRIGLGPDDALRLQPFEPGG